MTTTASPAEAGFRNGHPPALWILFFSEMWERFAFYGMRALLVLYMVAEATDSNPGFGFSNSEGTSIYAAYMALLYAAPLLGGYMADKILGYRQSILYGGLLMAAGLFLLLIQEPLVFFWALALVCVGNGFFKPNISSTVGRLYAPGDRMRDRGFSIFYMGINIGAAISPLACGWVGEEFGWRYGFGLAGLGMILGLVVFARGKALLEGRAEPPDMERFRAQRVMVWLIGLAATLPVAAMMKFHNVAEYLLLFVLIAALGVVVSIGLKQERIGRDRVFLFLILWFFHALFWALFEQAGSSLTLFAKEFTDRDVFGTEFPITWTQFFNPFFIVTFAPLFSLIWATSARMKKEPNIPAKFGLGVIQVGLGFLAIAAGTMFLSPEGLVPLALLIFMYLLHTTGELCLSPVGLSAVTKLAPAANAALFMGIWFLSFSAAHQAGGQLAKLTDLEPRLSKAITTISLPSDQAGKELLDRELRKVLVEGELQTYLRGQKTAPSPEAIEKKRGDLEASYPLAGPESEQLNAAVQEKTLALTLGIITWKDEQPFSPALTAHLNQSFNHLLTTIGQQDPPIRDATASPMAQYRERAKTMLLEGYSSVYRFGGWVAVILGVLLVFIARPVNRLAHGVH